MKSEELYQSVENHSEELFSASDRVWEAAELGYCETESSSTLKAVLTANGFVVEQNLAGIETAFSGRCGSGSPVIGFLGEFDALTGLSQEAGALYRKPLVEGGNGHGCGHNLLGVGSLAAAIACKEYLENNNLPGTVIYFGCPAEEGGSGKGFMAKAGVFDELDVALSWHPGDSNMVSSGSTLANLQVKYKFTGVSSHAAVCPHLGRSALDAVELMDVGANYLREHIIPEARVHYAISNAGGCYPNVVQSYAEVIYLIRAPKTSQVQDIYARINKIAEGAALMTETKVESEFIKACSDTVPNSVLEKVLYKAMKQTPIPEYTEEEWKFAEAMKKTLGKSEDSLTEFMADMEPSEQEKFAKHKGKAILNFCMPYIHKETAYPSSTDVGDVSYVCPTVQMGASSWVAGTPVHTWQVTAQGKGSIAHKSVLFVGKVLSLTAIDLMEHPEIIAEAKKEHRKRTGGRYCSPIPDGAKPRRMV